MPKLTEGFWFLNIALWYEILMYVHVFLYNNNKEYIKEIHNINQSNPQIDSVYKFFAIYILKNIFFL